MAERERAAEFYASVFPDSEVGTRYHAASDYPDGKQGDELTIEFTVLGMPLLGLNGGPRFQFSEAISFQVFTESQAETDRYWDAIVGNGGVEKPVRLVQGQVRPVLADHPACADAGPWQILTAMRPSGSCRR